MIAQKSDARDAFRKRLRIVALGILVFAAFLLIRLYFVQIIHGGDYALKAEHQYVHSSQALYDRGTIFFTRKDGTLLSAATLSVGFRIAINPSVLKNPDQACTAIQQKLPSIDCTKFATSAAKADDPYEVIMEETDDATGKAIDALDIPGILVERIRWRSYPAGDNGAQTLGFIGYDNNDTLAGRLGLESYYQKTLDRNNEGLFGNFFAELFGNIKDATGPLDGAEQGDVITSLEPVVLEHLMQTLQSVEDTYHSRETGGIIMDPKTGEIIAMASIPSFDPNNIASSSPENLGNPLVENNYEFGSIMKTLTMASGLDAGVITPDSTYNDTGCLKVNGSTICNYDLKARGVIPMQQILSQSLNVGVSHIATLLGHDRFRQYFTKLSFGTETGIDLPGEVHGFVGNLNSPRDVEYDTASFGQGIAETPVEMIRALGTLANNGAMVTPHVATAIQLESGIRKELLWGKPEQVFSAKATQQTTDMMIKVVDTALLGGKAKIPEISIAAKTGTAQIADQSTGHYYKDRYFHSFVGYFPASNPKFIILLYTREPQNVQYASETLTKPFIDLTHFLINYYGITPDRTVTP